MWLLQDKLCFGKQETKWRVLEDSALDLVT